jgi:hypothetical protein
LFGADLVNRGFLKLVVGSGSSPFGTSGVYYQWKKLTLDNEPSHVKARREAERVEAEYKRLVREAESQRCTLESLCVDVSFSFFSNLHSSILKSFRYIHSI